MTKIESKYFQNGGDIYHVEAKVATYEIIDEVEQISDINQIQMMLDPNDADHIQIITALDNDLDKVQKYAIYLANGGANQFNLTNILNAINS